MFAFTDRQASIISDIIGLAYTDILSAEVWTSILRLVDDLIPADASAAIFFDTDSGKPVRYANHGFDVSMYNAYEEYYHTREPILPKALAEGTFTWRPQDLVPDRVWRNTEIYTDFIAPNGVRHVLTSAIPFGTSASVWMRLIRTAEDSPFSTNDVQLLRFIQPHLSSAHAKMVRNEERYSVKKAILSSFDSVQNALFIFDQNMHLVHMNPSAVDLCAGSDGSTDEMVSRVSAAAANIVRSEKHPFYAEGALKETSFMAGGRRYALAGFPIQPTGSPTYYVMFASDVLRHLDLACRRSMVVHGLSPREIEVCDLLIKGLSNREIADLLCVTELTVKDHVKNIRAKLRVTSRSKILLKLLNH